MISNQHQHQHQKPKQSAIAVECSTSQRQPLRGVAACPAVRPAVIDVGPVRSERDLHEALKRECGFPAFYGMNPDAFVGCDHRPCRHARTPAVHRLGRSGAAGENRRPRTSPSSTTPVRHVPRTAPAAPAARRARPRKARPRKARPGKAPRRGRQAASRCPAGVGGCRPAGPG
nr:barstar family protein [Streptomyces sp. NRRL F-4474]